MTPISAPTSISSQFRALVLDRMSAAGIIPAELARRLGCTDQNVALLLTPGRDYKLSTMERIAAAVGFQFSISDLEREIPIAEAAETAETEERFGPRY